MINGVRRVMALVRHPVWMYPYVFHFFPLMILNVSAYARYASGSNGRSTDVMACANDPYGGY
jgi:hypothetical protein